MRRENFQFISADELSQSEPWLSNSDQRELLPNKLHLIDVFEIQLLAPATVTASFSFFSVQTTRGHDAAANSGTFGSADEQAELQHFKNVRDHEQETSGGPAYCW
jgi:hypothetical protein